MLFGDAGDGGQALLFSFDNGVVPSGWLAKFDPNNPADAQPNSLPTITGITSDFHSCPGALQWTVPLTQYAQQAEVQFTYTPAPAYTASRLHMWVKLVIPSDTDGGLYGTLAGVTAPFAQWHVGDAAPFSPNEAKDYSAYLYPPSLYPPGLPNNGWRESVIQFNGDAGAANLLLDQIGANLYSQAMSAGTALPTTTTLLIDDVWIE
jgi:hypothetical protein